jgi:hypothetical protein
MFCFFPVVKVRTDHKMPALTFYFFKENNFFIITILVPPVNDSVHDKKKKKKKIVLFIVHKVFRFQVNLHFLLPVVILGASSINFV